MYLITTLARQFGLSRSTLLYYDRAELLKPSGRSEAGYRLYSEDDRERLALIRSLRQAGLTVEDIRCVLTAEEDTTREVLKRRMRELGTEVRALLAQQSLLAKMLRIHSTEELPATIDKEAWVEMLRAAGMDEAAMKRWHVEFERRAPEAHHQFLLSLGVQEDEARHIREWSALRRPGK